MSFVVMDKTGENYVKKSNELIQNEENNVKNKPKVRTKKRKRIDSDTSSDGDDVLPENTLEVERNLTASAIKNNLDDISVKKILKKVVTNDHVLALVKLREEEEDSGTEDSLRPKLTRAKAKELMKKPWKIGLTPIKHIPVKTRPEVKALIAQELPDDEDDDEYEPTHDDVPSDDDHIPESCSELDLQLQTPATPGSLKKASPKVVHDGPFKVPPEIKTDVCDLDIELDEQTIALRTRSKLSLSSTPIEHIESSFVPPDELPMPHVDDLWSEFLNECLNPAPNARNEEDDETDPEYNVAADPDAIDEDEALENSIVKISKKELNDLVTELFHVMPQGSDVLLDDLQSVLGEENNTEIKTIWEGKTEPPSDEEIKTTNIASRLKFERRNSISFSVGKTEIEEIPEMPQTTAEANVNGLEKTKTVVQENLAPVDNQPMSMQVVNQAILTPVINYGPLIKEKKRNAAAPKITVSLEEREAESGASRDLPPAPLRALLNPPPSLTVRIELDDAVKMYPQQLLILQQQLRQHIQLATSNYLQLYVHPLHWNYAPQYKEYLVSLNKMTETNPRSVVDVCNLKPAMELLESWESSLSENTPEAKAMIEFMQKEMEKCRCRRNQNRFYVGDFPEMFKSVVANSSVFLYPYLLPPTPYRADIKHKRFCYLPSEDKYIVLGLDQFWRYVENNKQLFKQPPRPHPRHRWGLATAVRLVCRHMLPGVAPRALRQHALTARRSAARHNPLGEYFKNHTIEPVKHKLLPFNPKITLYEQPEFEIPRIWIRYLAKSSKRFRDHFYKRSAKQQPAGVDIEIGENIAPIEKGPLPIDFTKPIICNRINVRPPKPERIMQDKVDIHVQRKDDNAVNNNVLIAANIYTIVNTSTGSQLVPLEVTNTVNRASTPICTPAVTTPDDKVPDNNENALEIVDSRHCKCCILLKKIRRRKRQTLITDYYSDKKAPDKCGCDKEYPRITDRLRILIRNYQSVSNVVYRDLLMKIEAIDECVTSEEVTETSKMMDINSKDLVFATLFQIKLLERLSIAKNSKMKLRVHAVFSGFDLINDDPLKLTDSLFDIFGVEMVDFYKEFLCLLTPEQADKIDQFKDYFMRNCIEGLIAKVEEQVVDLDQRNRLLKLIKSIFLDNVFQPCEICHKLMSHTIDYPGLVEYIYSLFPHRRKNKDTCDASKPNPMEKKEKSNQQEQIPTCKQPNTIIDYEADNSSSEEDADVHMEEPNNEPSAEAEQTDVRKPDPLTTIKYENAEPSEISIDETVTRNSDSNDSEMSMLIMSDDESFKVELPEWKREEDKVILEVLKQSLTPEELRDKTILEIIDEKNVVNMICDGMSHKSLEEVRARIMYLLEILVPEH